MYGFIRFIVICWLFLNILFIIIHSREINNVLTNKIYMEVQYGLN